MNRVNEKLSLVRRAYEDLERKINNFKEATNEMKQMMEMEEGMHNLLHLECEA